MRSPTSVLAATRSPRPVRDGAASWKIDPHKFPPADLLKTWQRQLDELGLRATGTRVHERYIDTLHERLQRAGVKDVHSESVPFKRWTTHDWKLEIVGGTSAGPVKTASYIPTRGIRPQRAFRDHSS